MKGSTKFKGECPPGQNCETPEVDKEKEKPSIKEMRNALLLQFHPDIDGLAKDEGQELHDNEKTREVVLLAKEAEAGDYDAEEKLKGMYREFVLGVIEEREEVAKETISKLEPYLKEIKENLAMYLFDEVEEVKSKIEEFNKLWQEFSPEEKGKLKLVKEIHDELVSLRSALNEKAEKFEWSETETRVYAGELLDKLEDEFNQLLEVVAKEPPESLIVSQAIFTLIKLLVKERQELQPENKDEEEKSEEDAEKKDRGREEVFEEFEDDDDDYYNDELEEEASNRVAAKAAAAVVAAATVGGVMASAGAYEIIKSIDGDDKVVVTNDKEHLKHLENLSKRGFIKGKRIPGSNRFQFDPGSLVVPWCVSPPDEFFLESLHHHGMFPKSLRHKKRPGRDEFYPEAVFFG